MMEHSERGVSTVMDVALGLLLVSAAVGLVATQMTAQSPEPLDTNEADHAAETISQLTFSVTYQVRVNSNTYTLTKSGTGAEHIRHAVLLSSYIGPEPVVFATNYPQKVKAALTERLRGAVYNYNVTAQWQPYEKEPPTGGLTEPEDPIVHSKLVTGPAVTPERNVSSSETIVLSDMETGESIGPNPNESELARELAEIIVAGYFPVTETQLKLDQGGKQRSYVEDRYLRMATILEEDAGETQYYETVKDLLNQTAVRTINVNGAMVELLTPVLREDIESGDTAYVRNHIKTGRVDVTIKTWEESQ